MGKKVQLPWKRVLNFFPILRKGGKAAPVEREKEKEREKESQEPWLSSWIDKEKEKEKEKEALVEREKEEREKEVIPTAQVKCHQLRISWLRHRILLQLRFVCSPPWDGLTVTW